MDYPPVLDAYLLDFFKYGQVDTLVTGNGIRRGEVWYILDSLVTSGIEVDFAGKEMRKYGASKDTDMAWESEDDKDDEVEGELNSGDKKVCEAFSILRREFYIKFQRMCV